MLTTTPSSATTPDRLTLRARATPSTAAPPGSRIRRVSTIPSSALAPDKTTSPTTTRSSAALPVGATPREMPTPFSETTPEEIIRLAAATLCSARQPDCSTQQAPITLSLVTAAASATARAATPSSAALQARPTLPITTPSLAHSPESSIRQGFKTLSSAIKPEMQTRPLAVTPSSVLMPAGPSSRRDSVKAASPGGTERTELSGSSPMKASAIWRRPQGW